MIAVRLVTRSTSVIVTLILARLLSPADFGLVAVGVLAVSLVKVFTEVGFNQALIKESQEIPVSMLNTVWTIEALRGTFVSIVVIICAPWIAAFFSAPDAASVIRVLGLTPFLHGLTSIRIIYLQKELEFNKQFIYEISAVLGPLFVAIPLAFILQNVWALVFGTVASVLFQTITSYCLMPYVPKFKVDTVHFKKMFTFGKWIFVGSIVSYFAMELDTYIAAKLFDARLLGIYVLAFSITNKPIIEIVKALGKVLFPAYAKIGECPDRVKNAFLKSTPLIYSVIIPLCLGLSLVASDFIHTVLDEKWIDMIPVMQILAIAALVRGFGVPAGGLFLGIGKPRTVFLLGLVRLVTLLFAMLVLIKSLGPTADNVAFAVLIANCVFFAWFILFTLMQTDISLRNWTIVFMPLIAASIIMVIGIQGIHRIQQPGVFRLITAIITGAIFYIGTLVVYWRCFNEGPFRQALQIFQSFSPMANRKNG